MIWKPKRFSFWKPKRYRFKRGQWQWQRLQSDHMLAKQVKNGWQKPWTLMLSADSALCTHGSNMWDMDKAFSWCGLWFHFHCLETHLIEVAALLTTSCMVVILPQGLSGIFFVSTHFCLFLRLVGSSSCLCGWLRPTVKGSGATF